MSLLSKQTFDRLYRMAGPPKKKRRIPKRFIRKQPVEKLVSRRFNSQEITSLRQAEINETIRQASASLVRNQKKFEQQHDLGELYT